MEIDTHTHTHRERDRERDIYNDSCPSQHCDGAKTLVLKSTSSKIYTHRHLILCPLQGSVCDPRDLKRKTTPEISIPL